MQIEEVPETIGEMQGLADLWLYSNKLSSIPDAIGNCKGLKRLWIDRNAITSLPDSIGGCTALEQLYASDNCLKEVPPSLVSCTKICRLSLDGNDPEVFSTLPPFFKDKLVTGTAGGASPLAPLREPGSYPSLHKPEAQEAGSGNAWGTGGATVHEARFSIVEERPQQGVKKPHAAKKQDKTNWPRGFLGLFGHRAKAEE